jgi:hypothetical protein
MSASIAFASAPSVSATPAERPVLSSEEIALRRALHAAWRTAANAKTTTAAQHAAWTLMRGGDIDKAFSPLVHPGKIASASNNPWQARDLAVRAARAGSVHAFAPWADMLKDVPIEWGCYKPDAGHPILSRVMGS